VVLHRTHALAFLIRPTTTAAAAAAAAASAAEGGSVHRRAVVVSVTEHALITAVALAFGERETFL
jgi:hypothetical protein